MSNVIEAESLDDIYSVVLKEGAVAVIDFAAPSWCIPCQRFAPHFDMASDKKPGISFVHVDVDKVPEVMVEFGVQSVPTVMLFRNGQYKKHLKERTAPLLLKEIEE